MLELLKRLPMQKIKLWSRKLLVGLLCVTLNLGALYGILNSSQLHRDYLRHKVGSNVVEIVLLDNEGKPAGGGTGFAIKSPHGNKYILTNAHVCDAFHGAPDVNVKLDSGSILPRRILKISDTTDLCLVEGVPGYDGLSLASSSRVGEEMSAVGHPHLMPTTITSGEMIGSKKVDYIEGIIDAQDLMPPTMSENQCHKPKNHIEKLNFLFVELTVCMVSIQAQQTTIVGLPGNSGSPIVNWWGNVTGILFAGDEEVHWSDIVPLADIKAFIAPY